MFNRAAGIAAVAALSLACSGGPEKSPFFFPLAIDLSSWEARPGMPLDSVEQFLRLRDELGQGQKVWDRCDPVDTGARRCSRSSTWRRPWDVRDRPPTRWDVVAAADGRVVYLAFAPPLHAAFDDTVNAMSRRWARARGVRLDPGGVSDANPYGIAEMRSGRWRALFTHAGQLCEGTERRRYCATLIQLVDWRDGRQYADMTVPR